MLRSKKMADKRYIADGNGNEIRQGKVSDNETEYFVRPEGSTTQERVHMGVSSDGELNWYSETNADGDKVGGNRSDTRSTANIAARAAMGMDFSEQGE